MTSRTDGFQTGNDLFGAKRIVISKGPVLDEYGFYVQRAAKFIDLPYIALHRRLEKAFAGISDDRALALLKSWYYEADKEENKGRRFNKLLKDWIALL